MISLTTEEFLHMIKGISVKKREVAPEVIMFSIIGFVLGRVAIFGFINPMAIGFLAYFLLKKEFYPILLFTTIGIFTRFGGIYFVMYLGSVVILGAVNAVLITAKLKISKVFKGIVATLATIIPGLLTIYMLGFFYLAITFLMSLLSFSLVFLLENGIKALKLSKRQINSEAVLSLSIIFAGITAGAADIHIGLFSLKYFATALVVLMASKAGATFGASSGVVLGLLLSITSAASSSFIGILAVAGLTAGAVRDSKFNIGKIFGFIVGGVLTALYIDVDFLTIELLFSTLFSYILFMFAPGIEINLAGENNSFHAEKIKSYLSLRLSDFSKGFKTLSNVIEPSYKKQTLDHNDTSKLIQDVSSKICKTCPSRDKCWGDNFYNTYQMFFALLAIAEKKGKVSEIPKHLEGFCIQPEDMINILNNHFEEYKERILLQNKISENREIVHYNLNAFSEIIGTISTELSQNFQFIDWAEAKIEKEMGLSSVVVLNKFERFEAIILNNYYRNIENIEEKVSKILGKKMVIDDSFTLNGIKLIEEPSLKVQIGHSSKTKDGSEENGDSHSFMTIRGHYAVSLLADGMGSGKKAKEESVKTLDILESFIKAGFDKEIAIRMINSALMQNDNEDKFATIDICQIDLYTGVCEFIKLGSATTYIVREDSVFAVKNKSLPIGIIGEIDIETSKKRLKEGDKILMLTDGVTENGSKKREDEILEILAEAKDMNHPKAIADLLIKNLGTEEVGDDMTVLVSIIKNN